MKCLKPRTVIFTEETAKQTIMKEKYPDGLLVPCGRCVECRIAKAREWETRLVHESKYYEKKCFVTLTYNNECLPKDYSLKKKELQKWIKRLRKRTKAKIKYYACGEYGTQKWRPHYHIIILGLGLEDRNQIEDTWGNGFVHIGTVTSNSIKYTADYTTKTEIGKWAKEYYGRSGREPPFRIMSKGIGLKYAKEQKEQLKEYREIKLQGYNRAIPRYYVEKLGIDKELMKLDAERRTEERILKANKKGVHILGEKVKATVDNWEYLDEVKKMRKAREEHLQRKLNKKKKGNIGL